MKYCCGVGFFVAFFFWFFFWGKEQNKHAEVMPSSHDDGFRKLLFLPFQLTSGMFLKTHDNFIEACCVEKVRKLGAKYRSFPVKKWSTVKITWITCFKRKQLLLQSLPLNVSHKLIPRDDNLDKSNARAQVLLENPYLKFQWQPTHNKHQRKEQLH